MCTDCVCQRNVFVDRGDDAQGSKEYQQLFQEGETPGGIRESVATAFESIMRRPIDKESLLGYSREIAVGNFDAAAGILICIGGVCHCRVHIETDMQFCAGHITLVSLQIDWLRSPEVRYSACQGSSHDVMCFDSTLHFCSCCQRGDSGHWGPWAVCPMYSEPQYDDLSLKEFLCRTDDVSLVFTPFFFLDPQLLLTLQCGSISQPLLASSLNPSQAESLLVFRVSAGLRGWTLVLPFSWPCGVPSVILTIMFLYPWGTRSCSWTFRLTWCACSRQRRLGLMQQVKLCVIPKCIAGNFSYSEHTRTRSGMITHICKFWQV